MIKAMPPSIPHEEVMMDMLKNDPEFAAEYLKAAMDEAKDAEGKAILLDAVRRITTAQDTTKERDNIS